MCFFTTLITCYCCCCCFFFSFLGPCYNSGCTRAINWLMCACVQGGLIAGVTNSDCFLEDHKMVLWVDIVLKYKIFYNKLFSYSIIDRYCYRPTEKSHVRSHMISHLISHVKISREILLQGAVKILH